MTDERRNEILNRAISKYGLMNQMNMCIEEMAKYIVEFGSVDYFICDNIQQAQEQEADK